MDDMASVGLQVDSRPVRNASGDLDKFARSGDGASRSATGATGAIGGMSAKMVVAAAAAAALAAAFAAGKFLNKFVDATVTAEAAQAQLGAVIASTGGAAGRSVAQLNEHAASLQKITNFGDEAINTMQGVLLTFTQVRGDQFDAATVAVMDLATAMGTDLSTAALQVGRALNDPVLGMTALSRSGIQFTEAQKDMVKEMVAANDVIGAQTIILSELETQFGGSADAARGTLGGALDSLRNAWGDLFEMAGPASENLRASIEGMIVTVTDPGFVIALQTIGTLLFKIAGFALDLIGVFGSLVGAFGSVFSWIVRANSANVELAESHDTVSTAITEQQRVAGTLKNVILDGIAVTMADARAVLENTNARLLNLNTSREMERARIREGEEYRAAARKMLLAQSELDTWWATQSIHASEFAPLANAAAEGLASIQRDLALAQAEQRKLLEAAVTGSTTYQALTQRVEETEQAIATAERMAQMLSSTAATVNFDVAVSSVGRLGSGLAHALGLAQQLAQGIVTSAQAAGRIAEARLGTVGDPVGRAGAVAVQQYREDLGDDGGYGLIFGGMAGQLAAAETQIRRTAESTAQLELNLQSADAAAAAAAVSLGGGGSAGGASGAAADLSDNLEEATTFAGGFADAMVAGAKSAAEMGSELGGSLLRGIGSVSDAFGDFVMSGLKDFKGFVSSILSSFKSMLAQMISMAVRNRIMSGLGFSGGGAGPAAAGGAPGGPGGMGGGGGLLGRAGSMLGGLGSAAIGGFMKAGGALLGAGGGIGSMFTSIGGQIGAAVTGSLTAIAGAIGAVALPVMAVAAVFSFFKKKTKELDAGLKVTVDGLDTLVQTFRTIETKRFWGLSKKVRTSFQNASDEIANPLIKAIGEMQGGIVNSAEALGISAAVFDGFAHTLQVSTKGLSDEAAQEAVMEAFERMGDAFAGMIPGLQALQKDGEGAMDAISRLAQSLAAVNGWMGNFRMNLYNVSLAGAGAASAFVDLFGSLENFNAVSQSYYANFFTDAERIARATELLSIEMLALGVGTLPATRAAFRALVDEADALGDSELVASLMQLSPAFAEISAGADALGDSLRALVNEDLFATGQDYVRGLSRASNSQTFTPQQSDAELRAELRALNVSMERLVSTSEITAGNTGRGADAADDTLAFQLEQTL